MNEKLLNGILVPTSSLVYITIKRKISLFIYLFIFLTQDFFFIILNYKIYNIYFVVIKIFEESDGV